MSCNMGFLGPRIGLTNVYKQEHSLVKDISIFMFSGKGCSGQTLVILICVSNPTELLPIIVAEMLRLLVWLIQIYFAPS